ncbi:hypothetical protein M422DRAFT_265271 [Sphaerobolus stellatus SS14]|uniref:Uncharacterized protein n=1 Tax=Sphaerobolus stellatus (strain SS14) TaxID=990650 RepID=A0A0C9V641_SPHS4|nr:hypothetical protein M422DRAFT_265271 [Sphaerobolus stellatus SS14]
MDINRTIECADNPLLEHNLTAIQDINSAAFIHTPQTTTSSPHFENTEFRLTPNAHTENRQHSLDRMANDGAMDIDENRHSPQVNIEHTARALRETYGSSDSSSLPQNPQRTFYEVPKVSGMRPEELDKKLWDAFLIFKTTVRVIAIERCKQESTVNRKFSSS